MSYSLSENGTCQVFTYQRVVVSFKIIFDQDTILDRGDIISFEENLVAALTDNLIGNIDCIDENDFDNENGFKTTCYLANEEYEIKYNIIYNVLVNAKYSKNLNTNKEIYYDLEDTFNDVDYSEFINELNELNEENDISFINDYIQNSSIKAVIHELDENKNGEIYSKDDDVDD